LGALALIAACSDTAAPNPAPPPPPPGPPSPPPPPPPPTGGTVTISGTVTYDRVPLNPATNGLNYAAITQEPARGIVVEALDSTGSILETTVADASGQYSVTVNDNTDVQIRARAKLVETTVATWDVTVRDNTNGDADYVLAGALTNSGTANSTRNLNAPSGWGGASYTGTRAAAPFAILDAIYDGLLAVNGATTGATNFPDLQVFWSVDNRAVSGDIDDGEITSTSFTLILGVPTILLVGNENTDTDEYDRHVIIHEFGHYLENQIARTDSIGGPHAIGDRLDPRLALSEGFANAYSAIVENDPIYRDSGGAMQASGFSINIENNTVTNEGWFSESSVHSILWDVFDDVDDGADTLNEDFSVIFDALSATDYVNSVAPATIFSFLDSFRNNTTINTTQLDALVAAQDINGTGIFGTGETNSGGITGALPVVKTVTVGGGALNICSVDDAGTFNKLGNRQLLRVTIPAPGSYTFTMTRTSGLTGRDPDFRIFNRGAQVAAGLSPTADTETLTTTLSASGTHWIDANDFLNLNDGGPSGDTCFDFSIN
jgi:hypothetical protein